MLISELKQCLFKTELALIGFPNAQYDPRENMMKICPDDNRMPVFSDDGILRYGEEHKQFVADRIIPMIERVNAIAKSLEDNPTTLCKGLYIFSSCNELQKYGRMRQIAATSDWNTLMVLIAKEILERNMDYYCATGWEGFKQFKNDCHNNEVDFDNLDNGFIQIVTNAHYNQPETLPSNYESVISRLEQEENTISIEDLHLDKRSLIFSIVELDAGFEERFKYYACGAIDRSSLETWGDFQEFILGLDDETNVSIHVRSYSVGRGKSESPIYDELKCIQNNLNTLNEKYGIDAIQENNFTYYYEHEEEH